MKTINKLLGCVAVCALFSACVGPGTGPYGTYTEADRYRDQTNTALAVGATAIGATVIGTSLYHAGRHDGRRDVYYAHPPHHPYPHHPMPPPMHGPRFR